MLQKTKSEERTFITFSKEMENALLEKYSDSRVLRYSKRKSIIVWIKEEKNKLQEGGINLISKKTKNFTLNVKWTPL